MSKHGQSPDKPWLTGKQPGYTGYKLVVNVCEDELHRVWSDHEFMTQADHAASQSTMTGGVHQVAHALMTEAVRREIYLDVLIQLTQDSTFLDKWIAADEAGQDEIVAELSAITCEVLRGKLLKMAPGLVREMVAGFAAQRK